MMIIPLIVTVFTTPASAGLTLGGTYWNARATYGTGDSPYTDSFGSMYGPVLEINSGRFFFGSSLLFNTHTYRYENLGCEITNKRKNLNLYTGYSVSSELNIFGVVTLLTIKGNEDISGASPNNGQQPVNLDVDQTGFLYGAGISGIYNFHRSRLFFHYTGVFMLEDEERDITLTQGGQETRDTTDYHSWVAGILLGVGYWIDPFTSLSVGYRMDISGDDPGEDRMQGIVVTFRYFFR
jgi:hypothetical protein